MAKMNGKSLYAPQYWPAWLGVAIFWLIGQLPWNSLLAIGRILGHGAWYLAKRRSHIAKTNIRLCFPGLSSKQQNKLARDSIISAGEAIVETAGTYFNHRVDLRKRLEIIGEHHLKDAQAQGSGIILLGMHFNSIDIASRLLGQVLDFNAVYRPNNHPVIDWAICKGRGHNIHNIPREDMRQMVRKLRKGEIVWYAPDQDYGREHAVYVPFFGQTAATLTTTSRLAQMGKAVVIPCAHYRFPKGRYQIVFGPPLSPFPSGDELADTILINKTIESYILPQPEQYLWVHRRFKHQPTGRGPY
ncbi:Lipid A biosynthesis lauroyl acyltransferase [gamma proteobacterium HdN1]|nr:Lipid A biosynthesis lauroyl acyltransferase [gamma proteobacterium HdN1]